MLKHKQVKLGSKEDGGKQSFSKPGSVQPDFHQSSRVRHYRNIGNQAVQRMLESRTIQAKLKVGSPNDKYEQEADEMADRVMKMEEESLVNGHWSLGRKEDETAQTKPLAEQVTPLVQREELEEEEEEPIQTKLMGTDQLQRQEESEEEEEEEPVLTKTASSSTPEVSPGIESNINTMKGGGQPLSESTRSFFEPRFGADFSQVRVHNDSRAAHIAQAINAKAFTTGKDIVFNSGQYSPDSIQGRHLMAHELTHVVQQVQPNHTPLIHRDVSDNAANTCISENWARGLDKSELDEQIRLVRNQILDTVPGSEEHEVAYKNLAILVKSKIRLLADERRGNAQIKSISKEWARSLNLSELDEQIRLERNQILDTVPGSVEHETARLNLAILEEIFKSHPRPTFEQCELPVPPLPTSTIILVGSPSKRKTGIDRKPYYYSEAAIKVVKKAEDVLPGTRVTIIFFSPGYKLRGEDVYKKALRNLKATGANVVEVTSKDEVINYLNFGLVSPIESIQTRAVKVSRFFYFGHGSSTALLLNYGWGTKSCEISIDDIINIKKESFNPMGESYLFTCSIAFGKYSFMSVWNSHLGQLSIGPKNVAAFNASYSASNLKEGINKYLPKWFLGLPYMNKVEILPQKKVDSQREKSE